MMPKSFRATGRNSLTLVLAALLCFAATGTFAADATSTPVAASAQSGTIIVPAGSSTYTSTSMDGSATFNVPSAAKTVTINFPASASTTAKTASQGAINIQGSISNYSITDTSGTITLTANSGPNVGQTITFNMTKATMGVISGVNLVFQDNSVSVLSRVDSNGTWNGYLNYGSPAGSTQNWGTGNFNRGLMAIGDGTATFSNIAILRPDIFNASVNNSGIKDWTAAPLSDADKAAAAAKASADAAAKSATDAKTDRPKSEDWVSIMAADAAKDAAEAARQAAIADAATDVATKAAALTAAQQAAAAAASAAAAAGYVIPGH